MTTPQPIWQRIRPRLSAYVAANQLEVTELVGAAIITVVNPSGLLVKVTVVDNIHEWFITVSDPITQEKIFDDWRDHFALANESNDAIGAEMEESVIDFLRVFQIYPIRVVIVKPARKIFGIQFRKTLQLEYLTPQGWVTEDELPTAD